MFDYLKRSENLSNVFSKFYQKFSSNLSKLTIVEESDEKVLEIKNNNLSNILSNLKNITLDYFKKNKAFQVKCYLNYNVVEIDDETFLITEYTSNNSSVYGSEGLYAKDERKKVKEFCEESKLIEILNSSEE